ncbi:hypothetical protein LCGC14_0516320 [marine sediment metagenome]|uniref:Uncharacterized protein n=1 Tax=marine sediment metagenome TaxID=412755 RepID=A0A0F9S4H3_9ZZZZ
MNVIPYTKPLDRDLLLKKLAAIQGGPAHTPANPPQEDKVQPVGALENTFPHNTQVPAGFGGKGETNMRGEGNQLAAIPKDITAKVGPRSVKDTNNPTIKKVASAGIEDALLAGFVDEFNKIARKE